MVKVDCRGYSIKIAVRYAEVRSHQVDQDGDGAINFSEMLTIMIRMHKQTRESQDLLKVFEVMDKDGKCNSLQ